ncbi:MAG: GNAT family N-acetyltransferase [Candidatus Sulfotelmatobacter sp.]|jgi:GNAT superfamily N-acetyltransferase
MPKHSSTTGVRLLRPTDVATALELSTIAGWNQTEDDWRMLMDLAPQGCFGIDADGELVATATLISYGTRLAWIGMVLTKPEHRGRGFARTLVTHALESADSQGIRTVKLDATEYGRRLYESVGFEAEGLVERWSRPGTSNLRVAGGEFDSDKQLALDLAAFGADRSAMLEKLAKHSYVCTRRNAYLFARAGRVTAYLGPCLANDPASAQALITSTLQARSSVFWSWDLLPQNRDAVALASELGFTRQRVLMRMGRGESLRGRDDMVYAIAGFELG